MKLNHENIGLSIDFFWRGVFCENLKFSKPLEKDLKNLKREEKPI